MTDRRPNTDYSAAEVQTLLGALWRDVPATAIAKDIGLTRQTIRAMRLDGTDGRKTRAALHTAARNRAAQLHNDLKTAKALLD